MHCIINEYQLTTMRSECVKVPPAKLTIALYTEVHPECGQQSAIVVDCIYVNFTRHAVRSPARC